MKTRTKTKPDLIYRMLEGLRDELKPLLNRLLVEAQGTPALPTATAINELLIARGIVPRQASVAKVPRQPTWGTVSIRRIPLSGNGRYRAAGAAPDIRPVGLPS
jgi:hypothetical protein